MPKRVLKKPSNNQQSMRAFMPDKRYGWSIQQDTLEALIRISHSMVSRGDINFLNATHQFFAMKDRRLR